MLSQKSAKLAQLKQHYLEVLEAVKILLGTKTKNLIVIKLYVWYTVPQLHKN